MDKLTRQDLWSLEEYAQRRAGFRQQVLDHKRDLQLTLGEPLRLLFEDRLTIQYQIQEMLRIERVFEPDAIQEELDAYNPLIPDGRNWKATMLLEYADVNVRRRALAELVGVEHKVWVQVGEQAPVFAIADEDLERSDEHKTSSVHFLRWELDDSMILALNQGAPVRFGCDHPALTISADLTAPQIEALRACLDQPRSH
ncbi:conserved hypothetical protein [Ferrimonas balearica DSM 9799]|uniref:DUF3501 domain-containing protein n=1 Tax=Ferrimonas balearica (strain DSM 9799 / CCM 4581 / KCTC 23876 / PAT) TaxID=550540 RepID=E1SS05_FERBD|nr:DUF3501 family protein [Ferrimonas balearica]ADN75960.1 conserved hypothetical protein [Ferrimonas balearica DSM 9799]MBW3138855.1 DUF3501 family protein [Ferrimonas balearica]MBW3163539.1 DUF3501 family protein [Ferrimonas balearica]MBY5979643.1 DUF3501 family protein [Ferrimonas balearica]MBY6105918.1 DUF3501 family protein [Ferrimonas balearica]